MDNSNSILNQNNEDLFSDDWIFSSEAFAEGDEFMALVGYYQQLLIEVNTKKNKYKVNTRYIKHPDKNQFRKTIIFTHGHSTDSTWVTWIKLAVFLFNCDFDVILFDLPGFGKSTINGETKVNFKNWLEDGPHMVKEFLSNLKVNKVSVCGYCGGAALMIRTMNQYPEYFEKQHILYNIIIGQYPDNFETLVEKYKFNFSVFWGQDDDHPKYSYSYKWLKNKNKTNNKNIQLIDLDKNDELIASSLWAKGYGRTNTDSVFIFLVGMNFLNFCNSYYNENIKVYNK